MRDDLITGLMQRHPRFFRAGDCTTGGQCRITWWSGWHSVLDVLCHVLEQCSEASVKSVDRIDGLPCLDLVGVGAFERGVVAATSAVALHLCEHCGRSGSLHSWARRYRVLCPEVATSLGAIAVVDDVLSLLFNLRVSDEVPVDLPAGGLPAGWLPLLHATRTSLVPSLQPRDDGAEILLRVMQAGEVGLDFRVVNGTAFDAGAAAFATAMSLHLDPESGACRSL